MQVKNTRDISWRVKSEKWGFCRVRSMDCGQIWVCINSITLPQEKNHDQVAMVRYMVSESDCLE